MSEELEIKRDGMTPVKNSGRSRGVKKGDAILEPFLVDIKEYATGFTVSRDNWKKISTDAVTNGRRQPAFKLVLGAAGESPIRVWVVSDAMFHEMRQAWEDRHVN